MDNQTPEKKATSTLTAISAGDFAEIKVKLPLLRQVVLGLQANLHHSNADAQTRGEVRGGGKKPWRQKGTGRARVGSSRTPVWRGGGIVFGPSSAKNYSHTLPLAFRREAMRAALALKARSGNLHLANLSSPVKTTKEALRALPDLLALSRVLLVVPDATYAPAFRNLSHVTVRTIGRVNVLDIVNHAHTVFVADTYTQLQAKLVK